ncbi:MAG: TetR/AcrR family transcriptional regulator C-terminal domain-containing protein [Eubacteriales bacterium]
MAPFTRKAILHSFLDMCAKKTPDKITVRDIVDYCEINRNTFYYYFQDIYALVGEVFDILAQKALTYGTDGDALFRGVLESAEAAREYRKALGNIYISLGRDRFEEYLDRSCDEIFAAVMEKACAKVPGIPDVGFCIRFYKHAVFGIICDWIRDGMKEEPAVICEKTRTLITKSLDALKEK